MEEDELRESIFRKDFGARYDLNINNKDFIEKYPTKESYIQNRMKSWKKGDLTDKDELSKEELEYLKKVDEQLNK